MMRFAHLRCHDLRVAKRQARREFVVMQEWSVETIDPVGRLRLLHDLRKRGADCVTIAEANSDPSLEKPSPGELVIVFRLTTQNSSSTHAREAVTAIVLQACEELSLPSAVLGLSHEMTSDKRGLSTTYRSQSWPTVPLPPRPLAQAPRVPTSSAQIRRPDGQDDGPSGLAGVREPRRPRPSGPPPIALARELPAT